ncbi:hypothetical protein ABFX02_14G055500 [Erythranthe guttata]
MASPPSSPPPPQSYSLSPNPESIPTSSKSTSTPKKSAAFPWSHDETLALIQAYQEKWYSLKKGQLKSFQWEELSVTVAARCGFDEPTRTSTQCRHKIEKLRKRYRSELQKPNPNSWPYFELMDHMRRGPMPLSACPISAFKSNSYNNSNNVNHSYGGSYSGSVDYCFNNNNNQSDVGGSDDSDEEWNAAAAKKNKSKSINNIVHRDGKRVAVEQDFNGESNRVVRGLRNVTNGKRKQYCDDVDDDVDEELQVEEQVEEGDGGMKLAEGIRGVAEKFMEMENRKIEMMRKTGIHWMEMEKKRIAMILEGQKKILNLIGSAFGANKKSKMAHES